MARKRCITPKPTLENEVAILEKGYQTIAGADEAGRGSIFGPVCVGMVVLPLDNMVTLQETLKDIRDSKKLSRPKVYRLSDLVKETALAWGVGAASAAEVDQHRIMAATGMAARRAWEHLHTQFDSVNVDFLLTDSVMPVHTFMKSEHHLSLVKGDLHCLSIACGAILAKSYHDELVRALVEQHHYREEYQLTRNVGYGTNAHCKAIKKYGYTAHHRKSYKLKILSDE